MQIEVIQAVSILITAMALLINAYFSYRRLVHDEKSRNISATEPLLNQWTSAQMQEGIHFIVTRLRQEHQIGNGLSTLKAEDFKKVNYVTQGHFYKLRKPVRPEPVEGHSPMAGFDQLSPNGIYRNSLKFAIALAHALFMAKLITKQLLHLLDRKS